ncbi:MAG: HNH endonuclease family protein, partial [Dehalococcoidia bacterium]
VLDGTVRTPAAVFGILTAIYVDDAKFRDDFARFTVTTTGQRKRLAKYILTRLESDISGRACDPDTDPGTIEHILPENPAADWELPFPRRLWEASIYRLGNLTLLEAAANRSIGNALYSEKRSAYRASSYVLTNEIPATAPEEWTLSLLDDRQRELAKRAVTVWRSDF